MAKGQAADDTAATGRTWRSEQRDPSAATKELMQESLAEIQGLAKAAEAADTDADVDVSQTSTRKRKETETTPRAEATSLALSRSLTEKDSLLREQHEELEKLKKQVRRLSKESASASPAAPQTPSTPNTPGQNKVQFILCFSRYNVYFVLLGC
jgi:hypothetical protein